MRPIPSGRVSEVVTICERFPGAHSARPRRRSVRPRHRRPRSPDYGDAVPIEPNEVPAFWACGVTPQVVLRESGFDWFAGHEPGRMFVTDREESIAPLA
jgi:uncharacterized protein YcsI (UPF0317 family)